MEDSPLQEEEMPKTGKEIEYVCDHRVVKDGDREDVEFRVKFKPAWVRFKQFKQDDDKQLLKQYLRNEEYPGDRCVLLHLLLEAELEIEGAARGHHPVNGPDTSVPEDSDSPTRENWAKEYITEKVVNLSNEVFMYAERVEDLEKKLIMRNNRANHFKKIATDNEKECQKLRKELEEEKMRTIDAEERMEEIEDRLRREHARYSAMKDNFEALQENLAREKATDPRWRTAADSIAKKRKAEDSGEDGDEEDEEDDQQGSHSEQMDCSDAKVEEPVKPMSRREREAAAIRRSAEHLKRLGILDEDEPCSSSQAYEEFNDSDDGIREDLIDDFEGHQGTDILTHILSKRPRLSKEAKQEPDISPAMLKKLQAALPKVRRG